MNDASEGVTQPSSRPRMRLPGRQRRTAIYRVLGIALTAAALLVGAAIPASAAESMRVTFVRHGESAGNASGLIDTSTPGPVLTPLGQQQARDVVGLLGDNNYDAIYASTMVRTQLTAAPMSQYLRLPIQVLPGLQEIEAGVFEGTPEAGASRGYGLYPIGWALPGVIPQIPVDRFNKSTFMPGTEENGYTFDARVDGALQTIYDNGDRNAVVFSHGGTIMFWTMMNVNNLTAIQKLQLLQAAQLGNTDYVVIEGNNEDGWTLVDWNGQRFSPEPTLHSEIALQARTLKRQLTAAHNQVVQAFATRDLTKIWTAMNRGLAEAQYSVAKFSRAVNAKIIKTFAPPAQSEDTPAPHSEVASVTASKTGNSETADTSDTAADNSAAVSSFDAKPRSTTKQSEPEATVSEEGAASDDDKSEPAVDGTTPARNGSRGPANSIKDAIASITAKLGEKGDTTSSGTGGSDADDNTGGSSDSDSAGSSDSDTGGTQANAA